MLVEEDFATLHYAAIDTLVNMEIRDSSQIFTTALFLHFHFQTEIFGDMIFVKKLHKQPFLGQKFYTKSV